MLLGAYVSAGTKPANRAAYAAFRVKLSPDEQARHAAERLTFGPRPGDVDSIQAQGVRQWVEAQLHPERIPEDPELARRLQPFDSLRMSIRETYLHYPSPQLIAGVARGQKQPPDDPELRPIVERLAQEYRARKLSDADDDSQTERPMPADILSPAQVDTLRKGTPAQKEEILRAIPADKRLDFILALNKDQRRKLFVFAPVDLRRQLMLSVNPQNVVTTDLTEGKLLRAVYSRHQLEELLVDFWYNHFNVFADKGGDRFLVPTYEREAIRPRVFGKFYDLLLATAESPAMLFYLDNWQSAAPNAAPQANRPQGKAKRGLNENYGRELLELHTLGVDGGYTQKDVTEVARCFTGWTIAGPRKGGAFDFNESMHDEGPKLVLGHVIHAGGINDGIEVLKLLAHSPVTARHISLQLAQSFVADDPPPALVDRMTKTFLKKDGDLRAVVRTMAESPEFWSRGAFQAKVKTPFQLVASALRASNADIQSGLVLSNEMQKLGEPLYRKIEPTGYSFANAEWVSSAGLLERVNFASSLAHNRIPGVKLPGSADAELLASPEFQKR